MKNITYKKRNIYVSFSSQRLIIEFTHKFLDAYFSAYVRWLVCRQAITHNTQIKETGKKRIKKKIILTNKIVTDKGIISNPIFVYDQSKFKVLYENTK